MSEDTEFGLWLSFVDQSESFTLGFEAGMIFKMIEAGETVENHLVHTKNLPMIERIASRFNYGTRPYMAKAEDTGTEGWSYVSIVPTPTRLKVVK